MPDPATLASATALPPRRRWFGRLLAAAGGAWPAGHDWALWHRACAGDAASATELVCLLTPQAHGLAMQMLGRTEDAQDVVQDAFLRLWGARPADDQGARLATFFNTIVLNRCKTLLVQRREISTDQELLVSLADQAQQESTAADRPLPQASATQLQAALARLPARQRMALAMWAYADADVPDIARALELDTNATHQLLHRAKTGLRQLLLQGAPR